MPSTPHNIFMRDTPVARDCGTRIGILYYEEADPGRSLETRRCTSNETCASHVHAPLRGAVTFTAVYRWVRRRTASHRLTLCVPPGRRSNCIQTESQIVGELISECIYRPRPRTGLTIGCMPNSPSDGETIEITHTALPHPGGMHDGSRWEAPEGAHPPVSFPDSPRPGRGA